MVPDSSFYVPEKSMTSGRSSFGEPQRRDTIRVIRHGGGVKRSTYERVIHFLRKTEAPMT